MVSRDTFTAVVPMDSEPHQYFEKGLKDIYGWDSRKN